MSLTVPDSDTLLLHMRRTEAFATEDEDFVDLILQQATDLFQIATSLAADPTDELQMRMMTNGITAMAHALYVGSGNKDAMYSPFGSERMGSYSYSKAQSQVSAGGMTGIPMFDAAVAYFRDATTTSPPIAAASEEVFTQPFPGSTADPEERTLSLEGLDVYGHTGSE